jgi:hypothetical protein
MIKLNSKIYLHYCIYLRICHSLGLSLELYVLDATTLCDKVCQWLVASRWFSPGSPVSSTNKTDRHYITETEIVMTVALNTVTLTLSFTWIILVSVMIFLQVKKKSSPIYLGPKNLLCNGINWVSRNGEQRKIIKNNEEKNPKLLFVHVHVYA